MYYNNVKIRPDNFFGYAFYIPDFNYESYYRTYSLVDSYEALMYRRSFWKYQEEDI